MAYIGQQPVVGRYILLDQISGGFNGTTSGFTMSTAGGVQGVKPGLAQNVLLSLGGVIQQPGVDYTISGSGITFTTPPVAGTTFFATVLGDAQSVGTPSDGTVTPASIAAGFDFAFPNVNVTGVTTIASGSAATPSLSVTGDSNTGLLSPAANTLAVSTDGTERLRVDSTGKVGIGTTSPSDNLTVAGSSGAVNLGITANTANAYDSPSLKFLGGNLSTSSILFGDASDADVGKIVYNHDGNSLAFTVNASERLRIDSSGRVGIGTSSPTKKLHVADSSATSTTAQANAIARFVANASNADAHIQLSNGVDHSANIGIVGDGANIYFAQDGNERVRIDSSGNVGIGTNSPSYKLDIFSSSTDSFRITTPSEAGSPIILAANSNTATPTNQFFVAHSGAVVNIGNARNSHLTFHTNNTEKVRIDSSGKLGVGTSSPNTNLEVTATKTISNVDSFGQLVVKTTSGSTGNMLNIGVDETNSRSFIQSLTRGTSTRDLLLNPYGGNIGIGLASPATRLDISDTSRVKFDLSNAYTLQTHVNAAGSSFASSIASASDFQFQISNSEKLRIDSSGNLGIGVSSPDGRLHVQDTANDLQIRVGGTTAGRDPLIRLQGRNTADNTNVYADIKLDSDNQLLLLNDPGTTGGTIGQNPVAIDSSGRTLIGSSTVQAHANMDDLQIGDATGNRGITVSSSSSGFGTLAFGDSTDGSGTDRYQGFIEYYHNDNSLRLGTVAQERFRIDSSGNVGIGTTSNGSNAKFEVRSTTGSISSATSRINGGATTTGAINTGASLLFAGHSGVNERDFASIFAGKENGTSGNYAAYLAFATRVNGGSLTERLRISSDGTVAITDNLTVNDTQYPTAGALSNRNLIINGAMQVVQRGTSVTGIGVDDYTCADRFKHFASLSGQAGRCTATQENITDLAGFNKALKLQVTTTETPGSTESYGLNTRLELQDIKGLGIGTSAAVPLTLSFYAKAPTGNGVFCAGIILPGGGSYIEEVTIGTSWSRHEINIPATTNSAHAPTTTNDTHSGMEIQITLMAGSSRDDHGNGTWEADTANRATSNQSNFYSSTSNNLFITGVQLERGEKATPFEHRSFGDQLQKCKRYFQTFGTGAWFIRAATGTVFTNAALQTFYTLPVHMRATPTGSNAAGGTTVTANGFTNAYGGAGTHEYTASLTNGTGTMVLGLNYNSSNNGGSSLPTSVAFVQLLDTIHLSAEL